MNELGPGQGNAAYDGGMKKLLSTACLVAAVLLTGCGGGIYLGYNDWDEPPSVSLVSNASSAEPGHTVRLAAAASDNGWILEVRFYRVDDSGRGLLLGADDREPYDWDARIPPDAVPGSRVHFFARAEDGWGNVTESETVSITVR